MAWKISLSLESDAESLHVAEWMVYAAAKAEGASEIDAFAAGMAVREAFRKAPVEGRDPAPPRPIQIDLEYDEETLVLLVSDRRRAAPGRAPGAAVPGPGPH
jgi:anti-sigma regulatory factor (Ser/Thr protein kinase)